MLILAHIRAEANAASFSKGRAYFEEGAVHRLRYRPDDQEYTAIVSGSDEYDVQIGLDTDDGPSFWCNCPYNYEGICKHCVAVGLAVLERQEQQPANGQGPLSAMAGRKPEPALAAGEPTAPPETAPEPVSASELETALRDVPKPEQLKFLALQLRQNPALARAFLTQFVGPPLPSDCLAADATLPQLAELRDALRRPLNCLRFDHLTLADEQGRLPRIVFSFGPTGRFLAELADRIGQVLAPVLGPAAAALREALAAGRLAEGLRRWQGAWLAIIDLKKPAADTYNLFFGNYYARQVADTWLALLAETGTTALLETQPFDPAEVQRCLPVFVRAVLEPLAATPPLVPAPRSRRPDPYSAAPQSTSPPLPDAELALLLAVAANPAMAPVLRPVLQPHTHRLPLSLQAALAAGCHDWTAWEPLARRQLTQHYTAPLLTRLLHFYHEQARTAELVELATQHFGPAESKALVAGFVLAYLSPAASRPLYLKALMHRLEQEHDFADYETLADIWTDTERAQFVKRALAPSSFRLMNNFPLQFRARLLAHEQRVAEVLPLLLQAVWHTPKKRPAWGTPPPVFDLQALPELLALAARHQPEITLDAVMERVENYLDQTSLRSVELYDHIAEWLKALREVPVLEEQVALFAEGLFSKYSKLAFLRKALREAGLLPEPEARHPKLPRAGATPRAARQVKNPFQR
ncbi:SWIM zinc finger family protein [Hymenobacter aerophilus]|uniref:SWIM zinc finger family protein n=1 Tax=Hymenobacter aerophilus TaxID=119644 RepID=UPI00036D9F62|nr:hypothetical protein [Hymenobacter aerophilus]